MMSWSCLAQLLAHGINTARSKGSIPTEVTVLAHDKNVCTQGILKLFLMKVPTKWHI